MRNHLNIGSARERMKVSGRTRAIVRWLEHESRTTRGLNIADIGCGYGWTAWHYLQSNHPGSFICVEPDEQTREIAKSMLLNRDVKFFNSLQEVRDVMASSFDFVVSTEVLEHTDRGAEARFLADIRQCLKPGGIALITTPAATIRSRFLDPAFWVARHRHYSKRKLCKMFNQSNLRVISIRKVGGSAELLALWDLYISKWIFRRRPLLESVYGAKLEREWDLNWVGWMGWWIEVQRTS